MDKINFTPEQLKRINDKLDIVFQELKTISNKFEKKSKQLDKKDDAHDNKFEQINKKLIEHDNKFDILDKRFTKLETENREEHATIINLLTTLNSAFLRYETDGLDKIKILFDANTNHTEHQTIYGHEFKRLNDLVAKNSYRISNLESHFN